MYLIPPVKVPFSDNPSGSSVTGDVKEDPIIVRVSVILLKIRTKSHSPSPFWILM